MVTGHRSEGHTGAYESHYQGLTCAASGAVRVRYAPSFDTPLHRRRHFSSLLASGVRRQPVQLCFATMEEQHPAYCYLAACFRCRELGAALARFATAETLGNVTRGLAAGAPGQLGAACRCFRSGS